MPRRATGSRVRSVVLAVVKVASVLIGLANLALEHVFPWLSRWR
ncbi:hypothetical protein ACFYOT_28115 [Saccharothrix saharensis]